MKLHEYQAKDLFRSLGIPIQRGGVAKTPDEVRALYQQLKQELSPNGEFVCNVKAQIHAGGRGKAGGVLVARSADEAAQLTKKLLGMRLVTKQTGAQGLPVAAVLLDERVNPSQELYLSLTLDRFLAKPVILASYSGGMDIEEVAKTDPDAIARVTFDWETGLQPEHVDRVAKALKLSGASRESLDVILRGIWKLYLEKDASLIEINPLVITASGQLLALDAKITIDDNALFRQPQMAQWRDPSQEDPMEYKASQIGISYVGLSGNIGCLVNGAGLAMATNDIIKLCGGEPANFLDVGGGANVDQVTNAFSIILSDDKVKAILVNIFGGIMRCDWIAEGLLKATEKLQVKVPIVVRLQGTNVEEGRRLLRQSSRLNLISVDELAEAARKVVEVANA